MTGRTPSFILVGLVIVMVVLGLFCMSCSSKNTDLRLSLEQFEERIRLLTIKFSESEKQLETVMSQRRELEDEKLNIQRQMEKKDSEINDLNTKFNEKLVEVQSLKTDTNVLYEQLKEYKLLNETLASKNLLIEQLQKQLHDQKLLSNNQLKQEYETLQNNQSNNSLTLSNEQRNNFPIPPQRFRPFILNNFTTRSMALLFQDPLNRLNNLTQEIKPNIVRETFDVESKTFNMNTTTTILNIEQHDNQNVLAPPLINNNFQEQQKLNHVERAQIDRMPNQENQIPADNSQYHHQRLQRSINNSISDNQPENNEKEQVNMNNVPNKNIIEKGNFDNHENSIDAPPLLNNNNDRMANRDHFQQMPNDNRVEQQFNHGEAIDDHNMGNNNNNINEGDQDQRK